MKNLTDLKKKQQWITPGKAVANSSENFREILRKTFATWGWIAAMHLKLSGVATKAGAFEYFAYFTGKHLYWSLFLISLLAFRLILLEQTHLLLYTFKISTIIFGW